MGGGKGSGREGRAHVGKVGLGAVNGPAIMDSDRACRSHQIFGGFDLCFPEVPLGQTADPFAALVVLVEQRSLVAARDYAERPLIRSAIIEIGSDGQWAVIGVGPKLNVLVPFHLFASF